MSKPITTLFLLMSVDGKISIGDSDKLDFDKDLPSIQSCSKGLQQYYDIEQTTELWSLNSGRVMQKIGMNDMVYNGNKTVVSFAVIDNNHLNTNGITNMCKKSKNLVIITSNPKHPAIKIMEENDNLSVILQNNLNAKKAFEILYEKCGCKRLTIQTGGTLNAIWLREKLIDYVDIVIAPLLVGGNKTSTLIDGESLTSTSQLGLIGQLKLIKAETLNNSYLRLRYKVIN